MGVANPENNKFSASTNYTLQDGKLSFEFNLKSNKKNSSNDQKKFVSYIDELKQNSKFQKLSNANQGDFELNHKNDSDGKKKNGINNNIGDSKNKFSESLKNRVKMVEDLLLVQNNVKKSYPNQAKIHSIKKNETKNLKQSISESIINKRKDFIASANLNKNSSSKSAGKSKKTFENVGNQIKSNAIFKSANSQLNPNNNRPSINSNSIDIDSPKNLKKSQFSEVLKIFSEADKNISNKSSKTHIRNSSSTVLDSSNKGKIIRSHSNIRKSKESNNQNLEIPDSNKVLDKLPISLSRKIDQTITNKDIKISGSYESDYPNPGRSKNNQNITNCPLVFKKNNIREKILKFSEKTPVNVKNKIFEAQRSINSKNNSFESISEDVDEVLYLDKKANKEQAIQLNFNIPNHTDLTGVTKTIGANYPKKRNETFNLAIELDYKTDSKNSAYEILQSLKKTVPKYQINFNKSGKKFEIEDLKYMKNERRNLLYFIFDLHNSLALLADKIPNQAIYHLQLHEALLNAYSNKYIDSIGLNTIDFFPIQIASFIVECAHTVSILQAAEEKMQFIYQNIVNLCEVIQAQFRVFKKYEELFTFDNSNSDFSSNLTINDFYDQINISEDLIQNLEIAHGIVTFCQNKLFVYNMKSLIFQKGYDFSLSSQKGTTFKLKIFQIR